MHPLLSHYESVARESERMVLAARRGDWDALVAAEADCASRIEALKAASANVQLPAQDVPRKARILRTMLAHDAEIRSLAMPWMENLQRLIGASANERRVTDAYGRTP